MIDSAFDAELTLVSDPRSISASWQRDAGQFSEFRDELVLKLGIRHFVGRSLLPDENAASAETAHFHFVPSADQPQPNLAVRQHDGYGGARRQGLVTAPTVDVDRGHARSLASGQGLA